jgi:TetR/AcrR family transcriptional regulator, regulator of mycofactocin system
MQFVTGPQDADGRRRQRQITTRRSIEAAAWQLFQAKGYQATTVDEIVAEVGISQRTFFRYFDSKEAVLFGDWRWQLDDLARRIEKADSERTPLQAVQAAVLSLAHGMDRERRVVILRSSLTQSSTTVPRTIAGAAIGALNAALAIWVAGDCAELLPDVTARAFSVLESLA